MKKAFVVSNGTPMRVHSRLKAKLEELGYTLSGVASPERAAAMKLSAYDRVFVLFDGMGHKQFEAVERQCGKNSVPLEKIRRKKCTPEWEALAEALDENDSDEVPRDWVARHRVHSFLRAVMEKADLGTSLTSIAVKVGEEFCMDPKLGVFTAGQLVAYLRTMVSEARATPEFTHWWAERGAAKLEVAEKAGRAGIDDALGLAEQYAKERDELKDALVSAEQKAEEQRMELLAGRAEVAALYQQIEAAKNAPAGDPEYTRALETIVKRKMGGAA